MLAARIALPNFSVSSIRNLAKSAGEPRESAFHWLKRGWTRGRSEFSKKSASEKAGIA
jgi:hypothetical protein